MIRWEFNYGEPETRFGNEVPVDWPEWERVGFPEATAERPFTTSNFVSDSEGLVVGGNISPEYLLGKKVFDPTSPERHGQDVEPDPGAHVDFRRMRNIRFYADAVMWGAGTVEKQPDITPDLLDRRLPEARRRRGFPPYPKLVIATNSGKRLTFREAPFGLENLDVIILTGERGAAIMRPKVGTPKARVAIVPQGGDTLDMRAGLRYLLTEGIRVLNVEGGHDLIESLHGQGLLDEGFLTKSFVALPRDKVENPRYIFDFEAEGARHLALGRAGRMEFHRWRWMR